jgi:chemotaxis response regulator CheB
VLVGKTDLLQDVIRDVIRSDPALTLVAECDSAEALPAVWERLDADVVFIRPISADVPAAALPGHGQIPALLGLDDKGARGVVVLDDLSRAGLRAAVHAAAELRRRQEAG